VWGLNFAQVGIEYTRSSGVHVYTEESSKNSNSYTHERETVSAAA